MLVFRFQGATGLRFLVSFLDPCATDHLPEVDGKLRWLLETFLANRGHMRQYLDNDKKAWLFREKKGDDTTQLY